MARSKPDEKPHILVRVHEKEEKEGMREREREREREGGAWKLRRLI